MNYVALFPLTIASRHVIQVNHIISFRNLVSKTCKILNRSLMPIKSMSESEYDSSRVHAVESPRITFLEI